MFTVVRKTVLLATAAFAVAMPAYAESIDVASAAPIAGTALERNSGQTIRVATTLTNFLPSDGELLEEVRKEVMQSIRYELDPTEYKLISEVPDAREKGVGDCKSMSIAYRNILLENNFPADALLLAKVKTERGEDHAVLLIMGSNRGKEEIRVFDIRARDIVSVDTLIAAGYKFEGIQSSSDEDAVFLNWNGKRYL